MKIYNMLPGKTIQLKFIRGGSMYKTQAILGERPSSSGSDQVPRTEPGRQEPVAPESMPRLHTRQDDDAVELFGQRVEEPATTEYHEEQRRLSRNERPISKLHKAKPGTLKKDVILGKWQGAKHLQDDQYR